MEETNLIAIQEIVKEFLYLPIKTVKGVSPEFCVEHPFLNSCIVSSGSEWHNLLKEPEYFVEWQEQVERFIDDSDLHQLFAFVGKGFRLVLLKCCENKLSQKDLSELLGYVWVSSENPNQDPNCSVTYLVKLFKECDKRFLMSDADYKVYEELPAELCLYREVAVGRNPLGLSWTKDLEKVIWFSNRF